MGFVLECDVAMGSIDGEPHQNAASLRTDKFNQVSFIPGTWSTLGYICKRKKLEFVKIQIQSLET